MTSKCGTCVYLRPGERVVGFRLDSQLELEDLVRTEWGEGGACVADPRIRPLPQAWGYNKSRLLFTLPPTARSGRGCPRWDDGGRTLVPMELEKEVVAALEAAAGQAGVSPSAYLARLLETRQRNARKRQAEEPGDRGAGTGPQPTRG